METEIGSTNGESIWCACQFFFWECCIGL